MAELRRDPIIGQWVIVYMDNSLGPDDFEREDHVFKHNRTCQFCPGREDMTPPEVDAIYGNGRPDRPGQWLTRVVSNKFPALRIEGDVEYHREGIFEMANGIGAHEVLIETPVHEKKFANYTHEEIINILNLYQRRVVDLTNDGRFRYVMIFKNYGESAGTTVEHEHSQIIALPMIPKYVQEEMEGSQRYYEKKGRCVFCDMIAQESKERERIICGNDDFISFSPFVPRYPFECWILPKNHDSEFSTIGDNEKLSLAKIFKEVLYRIKRVLHDPAYNFYLHISPINYEHQKSFHWHIEIVPQLMPTSGFEWGTGFYVVRTSPNVAAAYLRNVSY